MPRKLIELITSLKLTIICLAAGMALIFAGTLAQVHLGIHEAQQRYFQSFFVWWPPEGRGLKFPIFPGGHLIGAVLLINLIAAHAKRFRWAWRKLGIHLTHAGLIIMLAGGLFTDLFAVESHILIDNSEPKKYTQHHGHEDLTVINTTNPDFDQVTAIPESFLQHNHVIRHQSLPFQIVVRNFFQNSRLQVISEGDTNAQPLVNRGPGGQVTVQPMPRATAPDDQNVVTAAIEIIATDRASGAAQESLGIWLVSDELGTPQRFSWMGKTWQLTMRPARYYKPYSVTLQKFTHEKYAGTDIPKNFASQIALIDPERAINRDILIYMNHPLRYRGETYYQAGFQKDDSATILQVVHNPSFLATSVASALVAAGLLVQFGSHLVGFSRQRRRAIA